MQIGSGSDAEAVKEQYKSAGGLNTRDGAVDLPKEYGMFICR